MPKPNTTESVPTHVGIIMDGNRRWAKAQGLAAVEGHAQGVEVLRTITERAAKHGVKHLSIYAFSTENWQRTREEVGFLMGLFVKSLAKYLDELHEKGVRLKMLGSRDGLAPSLLKKLDMAVAKTAHNSVIQLNVCWNYGGQQEIVEAAKKLINKKQPSDNITIDTFAAELYEPDVPPIDLVIRTSGEQRLSGFMLWRAAYAELYFSAKHWPEFTSDDFDKALVEFTSRGRRFGT